MDKSTLVIHKSSEMVDFYTYTYKDYTYYIIRKSSQVVYPERLLLLALAGNKYKDSIDMHSDMINRDAWACYIGVTVSLYNKINIGDEIVHGGITYKGGSVPIGGVGVDHIKNVIGWDCNHHDSPSNVTVEFIMTETEELISTFNK